VNTPILDTVQEVQILTLNNSAEFGSNAGAITNLVTKSGTNQWHGSAWEFLRNEIFDANSFFANHVPDPSDRKRLPLRLNQFGATFGGPIKKDKIFFLAAFQKESFLTASPYPVFPESAEFRAAAISAFPGSVSALLYSNFAPAAKGTPGATLREYVTQGQGSRFLSFAEYLCPANTDAGTATPGLMSSKFAALFGVEQADIDQMNSPEDKGGCPGGSPYATPLLGAFNGIAISTTSPSTPINSRRMEISSMAKKRRSVWITTAAKIIASSVNSIGRVLATDITVKTHCAVSPTRQPLRLPIFKSALSTPSAPLS
jgi:hypothetical protein